MSKSFLLLSLLGSLLPVGEDLAVARSREDGRSLKMSTALVEDNEVTADSSSQMTTEVGSSTPPEIRRKPGAFLGFSLAAVSDLGENNQYNVLYGDEKRELGFFAGYYLASYIVDLGLGLKLGYYNATGHPVTGLDRSQLPISGNLPENTEVDSSQEMELTLLPVQLLGNVAFSPFGSRRLVVRAWFGPEWLYVQESVKPDLPSSVGVGATSGFVNKGWNQGTVMGAMLSISITGLEARSDYAMRSIGIDRTYISPFFEVIKTTNDKLGNFDRKDYGIAFNFESLR